MTRPMDTRTTVSPDQRIRPATLPSELCSVCGYRCFQYEKMLDRVTCHRCVDEGLLHGTRRAMGLSPVVIVNRIVGADRSICDTTAPWAQMTQALQRQPSVSFAGWVDSANAVRRCWGIDVRVDEAAVFEYAHFAASCGRVQRKLYAALPARDGSCWVVQLGSERSGAYAVRQWASGLITTQELLSGVDRLPDA